MRIARIYQSGDFQLNAVLELEQDAYAHVVRVLRLREHDPLIIFNGQGLVFSATIILVNKKKCQILLTEQLSVTPPHFELCLAQAIIKTDKMDLIIQKAVELGVTRIVPLISSHCDIKIDTEALQKKRMHWEKIIIAACEQSGVNFLPQLSSTQTFSEWIEQDPCPNKLLLHTSSTLSWAELPNPTYQQAIAIGPEGGWSNEEIIMATHAKLPIVQLGPRTLRAETAAIASLSICQYRWDFCH